jgi:hypothetical protein
MHTEIELERYPRLSTLIREATELASSDARIGELAGTVVDFVRSGEVVPVLNDALRHFVKDPGVNLGMMQQDNVVLLNQYRGVLIAIGVSQFDPSGPIFTAPSDTLLAPLTSIGLSYTEYELNAEFDPAVYDPSVAVVSSRKGFCERGDTVLFEAGRLREYACTGAGILKLFDQRPGPGLMWEFDRQSGSAVAAYAADAESTTLRYLLRFLTEYGDDSSVDAINGLLAHAYHFVRWEAAKAVVNLRPDALPETLRLLENDKHPHVRNAVKKMLETLA